MSLFRVLSASVLLFALAAPGPALAQDIFRSILGPPRATPAPPSAPVIPRAVRPAPTRPAARPAIKPLPAPEPVKAETAPPPYEGEMSRLAEILGALHYLRPLCGAADGARWRSEMQDLIEIEQPPPERRDRLVESFNRSYGAYEQTYRSCTPAADLAIRRFLDEGARLSREIATKYGN